MVQKITKKGASNIFRTIGKDWIYFYSVYNTPFDNYYSAMEYCIKNKIDLNEIVTWNREENVC